MVNSVYLARKFSIGLRSLRRVGNTSGTIHNWAILPLRKLKRMWRRLLELFEETADWVFEQFLNLPTSIRKVLDRFCVTIWAWKRCAKLVPKILMCEETWIFQYDPETKRQSMHWKSPQSPRKKKARMSKSKFKAVMIVFFDIRGGLSTLIGCLKVRLSIRFIIKMFWRPSLNVCDEGDQTCGRMPHGFFIMTTRQHTTRYLWRGIWRKTTFQWWNIHRTLWT